MFGIFIGIALTLFVMRKLRRGGFTGLRARVIAKRLAARPDQRLAIETALEDVHDAFAEVAEGAHEERQAFADLMRAEAFEREDANAILDRRAASLEAAKAQLVDSLAEIHGVLEPAQRTRLARLVTRRGRRRGGRAARFALTA